MKRVGLLFLLACFSLSNAHAQVWRGLEKRVKDKAKQAVGVGDTTSSSTRNAQAIHPTAGPQSYAFCMTIDRASATARYSKIFPLTRDPRAYPAANAAWKSFVKEQYGGGESGGGCVESADEQAAKHQETSYQTMHTDQFHFAIREVDWTPESAPSAGASSASSVVQRQAPASGAVTGEQAAAATPAIGELSPDVRRYIDGEQPYAKSTCERTVSLLNYYDCSCVAQQVHAARLKGGTTVAYAAGGRRMLSPQLGAMIEATDLRSCVAPDKITAYTTQFIAGMSSPFSAEKRSALSACTSQKLVKQMQSDLHAVRKEDNFFSQDFSDCNMAQR